MESAPATIPATNAETFRCAFAQRSAFRVRVSATESVTSARCASAMAGATPLHDTRLGSSKTAEMAGGL